MRIHLVFTSRFPKGYLLVLDERTGRVEISPCRVDPAALDKLRLCRGLAKGHPVSGCLSLGLLGAALLLLKHHA